MADDTEPKKTDRDDGITAGGPVVKIHLPASIATALSAVITAMAPASIWLMYAIAISVILSAIGYGVARIVEAMK